MPSQTVIERLRAGGIVSPKMCVAEAARVGLPLEYAAALLEKESGGGHNVFGHDRDRSGKYIFPARDGTVKVTKELYLEYKRRRQASGNKVMQGVGPCQLTWFSFQDDADKEGGCWKPEINMRVGFRRLATLIKDNGEAVGARMYNGSGPAAEAYSRDLLKRVAAWRARLDGATPVHVPAANRPLRRGDRGAKVVRLTRRLAKARSKAGTPYLAKPRRELDATAEAALKAFQAEHRLDADGVYGPLSQRKLNRVVRLQGKRREEKAPAAATTAKVAKQPRLKSLVVEVQRLDAETGEAWDELVAHAAKRRRLLKRLQGPVPAQAAADAALHASVVEGFAAVTAALKEIDTTLDTLVETEQAEAVVEAAAVATAAPEAVAAAAPEPVATGPAEPVATGDGGVPPLEGAEPAASATATVTQAAPPAPPVPEGPAPPSPVAVPPPAPARRELADLSDEELLARIDRLDRALDRARAAMIQRFAAVEQDIGLLAPERRERAPEREHERKPAERPPKRKPAETAPTRPSAMPREDVKTLQKALNAFSNKYLKGFAPLIVDGVVGHATKKRIREAKAYLGYTSGRRSTAIDDDFLRRLRHPKSARYSNPAMLARAASRRRKQRLAAKRSVKAAPSTGVDTFEGKQVAAWLKPYLVWARNNGWNGHLNSGWRDPAYSEQLCRNICGAPTCPGRCAGRTSNHAGSVKPAGAVDVSDYARFGELMKRCPLKPPIYNALGARDPVHFSVTGR